MSSLMELRHNLARQPGCRIVSAEVFVESLTAHEHLVRADEPGANLLGLRDEANGQRILVPEEELARLCDQRPGGWPSPRLEWTCSAFPAETRCMTSH